MLDGQSRVVERRGSIMWARKEECKGWKGNVDLLCNLFCATTVAWEVRGWEAIKHGGCLKTSWPADPPTTFNEIPPSTSVTINTKHICRFFLQINPLLFHHNHLLHHCLQPFSHTSQWQPPDHSPINLASHPTWYWWVLIFTVSLC